MITPDYVRTMAADNAEMNRRFFGAAAKLSNTERKADHGAFWGSLHGTLAHILWGATLYGCRASRAGETRLGEVITSGGFGQVRRATETPFNMILEARP